MKVLSANKVRQAIEKRADEMFSFLRDLVLIETPSTEKHVHHKAHAYLVEKFEEIDYHCTLVKGDKSGGHFLARPTLRDRSKSLQLLLGHSDTVWPEKTLDHMPFRMNGRKISGPGVYDMKAGLAQIYFAIKVLREMGVQLSVEPIVFINSDEEIGSFESTRWIKRLAPLCNRALVLEPPLGPEGKLKTGRKGIGRFRIEIEGKAAHAGLDPEGGASAILELSNQIQKLFAMNDPANGVTVNVGLIEGGSRANVIAARSSAVIDVRVPDHESAKRITEDIHSLKPSNGPYALSIEGGIGRPPMEHTSANRKLWELARRKGKELEIDLQEAFAGGGSDGNTTSQYTATLDGLGATGDGAHAKHEFAFSDKIIERCALLSLLIAAPKI